jgi:hypothetical protein
MKLSLGITPRDYSVIGGASYDADAQAYFTANTSITSDADKTAINDFYLGLKTDSIYTKMKAMYLPIWSSSASNKWNILNPVDSDAAYRLVFSTGWTQASTGIKGNGTSAYIDTFILPSSVITQNSAGLTIYCRTAATVQGKTDIGSQGATGSGRLYLNAASASYAYPINISSLSTVNGISSQGVNTSSRIINTTTKLYKNGVQASTQSSTSISVNSVKMYIGALNNNGNAASYSDKEYTLLAVHTGLTDAEAANLSSRIITLMTHFGINV